MLRLLTRGHTSLFFSHRINPRQGLQLRIRQTIRSCLLHQSAYHTTPLLRERFSRGIENREKWNPSPSLYLPNETEVHLFRKNFGSESIEDKCSPHHHFISALAHEEKGAFFEAMEDYLQLSENNPHAIQCIEKAYSLLQKISLYNQDFLTRKEGVRIAFEKCLVNLDRHSPQEKAPTCFVCFNVSEKDVGQWLEETLVPDLDLAGIKPIFCFRDLSQGEDLDNFQELARSADLVIIACTPGLKTKYEERKKAPVGVAQEIRMIKGRYNDEDKAHTIFPIYLKGTRKESLPTAYFESIFGAKFSPFKLDSFEFNYFSNAFDLFSAMRKISREDSRKFRTLFLQEAKQIMRGQLIAQEVEQWREGEKNRAQALHASIAHRISNHTQMINLPFPPKDFTGRERELSDLHAACKHKHRVAVTGLGGMGKTALALQYGENYKSHYQFIHFVRAGTPEQIVEGLIKLADDLHIPKSDKPQERLQWLKTKLERLEREYLLIFDGMNQTEVFDEIEKYLPERGGCILLTSRMPEEARIRGFEITKLKPFPIEEAVSYLLLVTGSQEERAAEELVEKLGRLPLALKHAAGYIRGLGGCTIRAYSDLWDRSGLELFKDTHLTLTKDEKTILTTWKISIGAIETRFSFAKKILEFFAFMGEAPIPLNLIRNWYKVFGSDDVLKLNDALKCLCDYSMIASSSVGSYDIHALVQKVIQYQMSAENQQIVYLQGLVTIDSLQRTSEKDTLVLWNYVKLCMPHAMALFNRHNLMAKTSLLIKYKFVSLLGFLHLRLGNRTQALEVQKECLKVAEQWSEESPSHDLAKDAVAASCNYIGLTLKSLGKVQEGLIFHQKALGIFLHLYGENHPYVAASYNQIGVSLEILGKAQEGLDFLLKARKINSVHFGENHLEVGRSHNNLGKAFKSLGRVQEAIESHQKALDVLMSILGKNNPDIAAIYNNLGACHFTLGNFQEGLNFYKIALEMDLIFYGENHPNVAITYNSMGDIYYQLGKYKKASYFFNKALVIRLQVLGTLHPDVASSYNSMGIFYCGFEEYEKAFTSFTKAFVILCCAYGESHPSVEIVQNHLHISADALFYSHAKIAQKIYAVCIEILGSEHQLTQKFSLSLKT